MILLSPSKTQDFITTSDTKKGSEPTYMKEAKVLCVELRKKNHAEVASLMSISKKLASLNVSRFKDWSPRFAKQTRDKDGNYNFKQAIFAFRGDVYRAFENNTFTSAEYNTMEKNVLIISGFYGLLTPLTYIKPYRLEMKTPLCFRYKGVTYNNLYEYWRTLLTDNLKSRLKKDEIIINLASNEYSKVIDFKLIANKRIDVAFKNKRNGVLKIIAIYAKQQRGEMAVWAIKNNAFTVADLKKYKNNGYKYSASLSTATNLVFLKEDEL